MAESSPAQLKSICLKADGLFMAYYSMRELLIEHPNKLNAEFQRNPKYRKAPQPSVQNVKQEANPGPLPQFDLARFVDPDSLDTTLQALDDSIESICKELKPALNCFNRRTQIFDEAAYNSMPLDASPTITAQLYTDLFGQIEQLTKAVNNVRKKQINK